MTTSPSSTSSRLTSSRRTTAIKRSNGPAKTSRSRSSSAALIPGEPRRCSGPPRDGRRPRLARRPGAHRTANVRQGSGGNRPRLLRPGGQGGLDRRLVGAQLLVELADGRQVLHHRLGYGALEVAVSLAAELALELLGGDAPDRREDLDQVGDPGLVGAAADLRP